MVRWCVDAAFTMHENFKSHINESMTTSTDAMSMTLTEQKLNAKSFSKTRQKAMVATLVYVVD